MKTKLIIWVFCFNCFFALGQNTLTEIEYFFDTDPGAGNATNIDIIDSVSLNETLSIPISSLSSGIHILHTRTKNDLNQWSLYARQTFYITNFSSALNNSITEAEYFFDVDPGIGNAIPLEISETISLDETFSIPLDALSQGIHILHIRVKNNLNQWGLYARQVFYKAPQILSNNIVAAEFFIDIDPGVGNGTSIAITEGESIDDILTITLPTDLSNGDHFLHLRVLSSNGHWSLYGRPEFITLSNNSVVSESFKMYPNPVENVLNLSIQNGQIEKVVIIDINGKKVKEHTSQLEQLNLESLASGTYIIQISSSVGTVSKKLVKK